MHPSKLSPPRYKSGDAQVRLMCVVSAEHNEAGGVPYYWFAFHKYQFEFLRQTATPRICLGCGSTETTLLLGLSKFRAAWSL
jgi:hypothetical protein